MASYLLDEPVVSRWHSLSLLWSWKRTQRHEQRQINQRSHRLIFSIEITSLTLFLWSSAALHAFIISLSLSVWMTRSGDRPHWPLLSPTSSLSNDLPIPIFSSSLDSTVPTSSWFPGEKFLSLIKSQVHNPISLPPTLQSLPFIVHSCTIEQIVVSSIYNKQGKYNAYIHNKKEKKKNMRRTIHFLFRIFKWKKKNPKFSEHKLVIFAFCWRDFKVRKVA